MFEEDKLTHKIIGCAMKVHSEIGCGFQEVIYQRCLSKEFRNIGLSYEREKEMEIYYKGEMVGTRRVDFLVEGSVIVELKAVKEIEKDLLLNFGSTSLEFKRLFK